MENDEVTVEFMSKTGSLYTWPESEDISLQSFQDILAVLNPPTVANQRWQFKFEEAEIKKIGNLFPKKTIYFA
jgi:hypothetical protein